MFQICINPPPLIWNTILMEMEALRTVKNAATYMELYELHSSG